MSFIERALQKGRVGSKAATAELAPQAGVGPRSRVTGFAPASGIAQAAPAPRVAPAPQLAITEALLKAGGLRAPSQQDHQQRAEYRHVKQRLLGEISDPAVGRMILITSALQGEGKSFSAANLALSMAAEPDYSVLLVDADVIRPNITRLFGLAERRGLMDAVADANTDIESLVVSTSIEGLSILPAGPSHENATEYFASARMREVMTRLLTVPNRIVIVDSLPLLLTTEARALTPLAGQILLVVRAESTAQGAVLQAIDLLGEDANVRLLLNAVVRSKALDYMGYGYGYSYNLAAEK